MKKVLLITREFSPYCPHPGWMIRPVTLANFLVRQGYETHVIATKRANSWNLLDLDERVKVHWISGILEFCSVPPKNKLLLPLYALTKGLRFLFRHISWPSFIDVSSIDIMAYTKKAQEICERHHVRNVIISSPPHSLQMVGLELKNRLKDVNYIADFRDAWLLRRGYRPKSNRNLEVRTKQEQTVLNTADTVCFVSTGMLAGYSDILEVKEKAIIIENGFNDVPEISPDEELSRITEDARKAGKIVVGFFGSGSIGDPKGIKDLLPFIDAIEKDQTLRKKMLLVLFGSFKWYRRDFGIEIIHREAVPNAQARANMKLVDVGLVQYSDAYDAFLAMGGKIYDYVASGIVIWFVVPPESMSIRTFVAQTGKPLISSIFDPQSIQKTLKQIIREQGSGTLSERAFSLQEAAPFSRTAQYRKFLDLLN